MFETSRDEQKQMTTHKSFTVIDVVRVLDRYEKSANIPSSTRVLQRSFWNRLLRLFFTCHARQKWYFIICRSALFLHSIESLNPSMCVRSWWNMTPAANREPCYSERWTRRTNTWSCWCFRTANPRTPRTPRFHRASGSRFFGSLAVFLRQMRLTLAIRTCRGVMEF